MKKQILLLCFAATLGFAASAQTAAVATAAPVSKEDKAKQKEQQEADLNEAFKAAGLTDAQVQSVRQALEAAGKASKDLRADATLTEEQKAEAKKKINDDKNARLKEIMGADGYNKWNNIRRDQKAKAGSPAPAGGR